jgi:hypothetical protein
MVYAIAGSARGRSSAVADDDIGSCSEIAVGKKNMGLKGNGGNLGE